MPPSRVPDLLEGSASERKLAEHGLTVDDAYDVAEIAPVLIDQRERLIIRPDGTPHLRPARLRMVGPNRSGMMLTIVIEYPDSQNRSLIVTGHEAGSRDLERYSNLRAGRP